MTAELRIRAELELSDAEALALAQFVNRANAVDDDEAWLIRSAVDRLRLALAAAGFAPR